MNALRAVLVAAVGLAWALVWAFLSLKLAIGEAPRAAYLALTTAVVGTVLACRLCARTLARSRARWWLPAAALLAVAPLPLTRAFLWSLGFVNHELTGPTSPSGLTAIVVVRDAKPGVSADFYCNVRVLDPAGNVVAEWKDWYGQYPSDGPRLLRNSMRWTSARTLLFTTRSGLEQLNVP
ncbi:MAG TPA: hypothetical protein VF384_08590 [Planctomycetota bacterium]